MKTLPLDYWSRKRTESLQKKPLRRSAIKGGVVKIKPRVKKDKLQDLINEAVRVFHRYIKQRDSEGEIYACISCGKLGDSKEAHAGHFINAGNHSATKFHEFNVWLQCVECNILKHGNYENYKYRLTLKIGQAMVNELIQLSKTNWKWDRGELENIIREYKGKLK